MSWETYACFLCRAGVTSQASTWVTSKNGFIRVVMAFKGSEGVWSVSNETKSGLLPSNCLWSKQQQGQTPLTDRDYLFWHFRFLDFNDGNFSLLVYPNTQGVLVISDYSQKGKWCMEGF